MYNEVREEKGGNKMKRLYEVLTPDLKEIIDNRVDELIKGITNETTIENYKNAGERLKRCLDSAMNTKPEENDNIVCCLYLLAYDYDVDADGVNFDTGKTADVFGLDEKNIEEGNNLYRNRYAVDIGVSLAKNLGSYVYVEESDEKTKENGYLCILQEIFASGDDEKQIDEAYKELERRLDEIETDKDNGIYYTVDEMMQELFNDGVFSEADMREIEEHDKLLEKYRNQIQEKLKEINDENMQIFNENLEKLKSQLFES